MEGKRIDGGLSLRGHAGMRVHRQPSVGGPHVGVLRMLLRPDASLPPGPTAFPLPLRTVLWLCAEAQAIFAAEPVVLDLRAPCKVFGDIHGQYADLMRLFAQFGAPSREADGGDISVVDYLFLGDYVDRGKHSLETICLLLALKLSFPQRVFLVRGNHESPEVPRARSNWRLCL